MGGGRSAAPPPAARYEAALVNSGEGQALDTEVRRSGRVIRDDPALAARWFARLAPHLPVHRAFERITAAMGH